jgi:hypothetical protein
VLGNQETTLLSEQLRDLRRASNKTGDKKTGPSDTMMMDTMMMSGATSGKVADVQGQGDPTQKLIARLDKRISETVNRPASAALASIVIVEVTMAADALPGERELRLGTPRGVSNPLVFCVGQLPEFSRKPMITSQLQVLGKESQALRKRPDNEIEEQVTIPCTLNGQVASGELNRYRFAARQGQNLVITTLARQLIPFIADAVPGWFQPVLTLYDTNGKEVAYEDDYRFKPDPTLLYKVPKDGEYTLVIYDAIYRGREDFVYRITIGEMPFITSLFPLGTRVGAPVKVTAKGWNLDKTALTPPDASADAGIYKLTTTKDALVSNPLPFALDTLPELMEKEPNDILKRAQPVTLPVIINGRVESRGNWDVFRFTGKSNDTIVAEVSARRLESPLDSVVRLTDSTGKVLAFNDDQEDPVAGANTHHADSYLSFRLPADGVYYLHLGDSANNGGEEYGYRLRLSAPIPDFALRIVPSSVGLRGKSTATIPVQLVRKDGFAGPIKLSLLNPPEGFSATAVSLTGTQTVARLTLKTTLATADAPVALRIVGTATVDGQDIVREAVPAEDRMQAFLWRHLVPAEDFLVRVADATERPARPSRVRTTPPRATNSVVLASSTTTNVAAPKFTKQQVAGRLRTLKLLYDEGLLTDTFYDEKVAECEAVQ